MQPFDNVELSLPLRTTEAARLKRIQAYAKTSIAVSSLLAELAFGLRSEWAYGAASSGPLDQSAAKEVRL